MKKLTTILLCLIICLTFVFAISPMLSAEAEQPSEIYYADDGDSLVQPRADERFTYTSKEVQEYNLLPMFPRYYNTNSSLSNACAPVAGAVLLGYFDTVRSSIIPNADLYTKIGQIVLFKPITDSSVANVIQPIINNLYNKMGTSSSNGTSESNFYSALATDFSSRGASISKSSVMVNGTFNIDRLDAELKLGRPVVMFSRGYNYYSRFGDTGSSVDYDLTTSSQNHIMVINGYQIVKYFNGSTNFRTETYLKVSVGINTINVSQCLLNNTLPIQDAYGIAI